MPLFKTPRSLRYLALGRVSELTKKTCVKISKGYRLPRRRYFEAAKLRTYLELKIWPLLDEVCNYTFARRVKDEPLNVVGEVMLAAFMHHRMRTLSYTGRSYISAKFWMKHLNVPNLVELVLENLEHIPVQTFRILGQTCLHLQCLKFNFRSISILGISLMKTIKTLRVIEDTCYSHLFGNENVHMHLMRILLQELPVLEFITCDCMGAVLAGWTEVKSLTLKQVWDFNPTQMGLESIVRLCPHLERLKLECKNIADDGIMPLTKCSLQIHHLTLNDIAFNKMIDNIFINNGKFVITLHLVDISGINMQNLKIIGRHCPRLEELNITHAWANEDNTIEHTLPDETHEPIFVNLLRYSCADRASLFLQCLVDARGIQSIYLESDLELSPEVETDVKKIFSELIARNPLLELKSLVLYVEDFVLTLELIKHLSNLPKIARLMFYFKTPNTVFVDYLQDLSKTIKQNNLDLELKYDSE